MSTLWKDRYQVSATQCGDWAFEPVETWRGYSSGFDGSITEAHKGARNRNQPASKRARRPKKSLVLKLPGHVESCCFHNRLNVFLWCHVFFGHSLILFSFLPFTQPQRLLQFRDRSSRSLESSLVPSRDAGLFINIGQANWFWVEARLKRTYHLLLKIIEHPMNNSFSEAISTVCIWDFWSSTL